MAGHSHATNVKWRKDRQAQIRSQEHQKARKKVEMLIKQEGRISEKALSVAREHSFPKEKVHQIWEKWKQNRQKGYFSKLYQAPFSIILYCEGREEKEIQEEINSLSKEMQWNEIKQGNPLHYFRKTNLLEIEIKDNSIEEYLLMNLPNETVNKIEQMEIRNDQAKIIFFEKEVGEEIESLFLKKPGCPIKNKKIIWQPLVFQELVSQEAKLYAENLKQKIINNQLNVNFFANISLS